jgi:UDP-glucose 4-epimerase
MGSRILVTGGAGFIGSHVADTFLAAGHQVTVLDDLSSGHRDNVAAEADMVVADIRSSEAAALVRDGGFDTIVHHAAQIDVRRSVADPRFDVDVNLGGLVNLLEASRDGSVRQFIFASTGGAIYGDQRVYPAPEDHPTEPLSPYGIAKLAGERYLYFYHRQYGLDVACLRYANVYGPRQNPHGEAGVVAIFLNRLLEGGTPRINGDGLQTRDYVYVGDVAAANLATLGRPGFRIYNVGTGIETDVNQLYDGIRRSLGTVVEADHGPAQPGEQLRSSIDASKARAELGVAIDTALDEGLSVTAEWFRTR